MKKKVIHKLIAIFLTFILFFNCSVPSFTAEPPAPKKQELIEQEKSLIEKYSSLDVHELYDTYLEVRLDPEKSPYYAMSYEELLTKYEELSQDIGFMWSRNPTYLTYKVLNKIKNIIITVVVIAILTWITYQIGVALVAAGYPVIGELASIIPVTKGASSATALHVARVSALNSEKAALILGKIAKLFKSGKRTTDLLKFTGTVSKATTTAKGMLFIVSFTIAGNMFTAEGLFALENMTERVNILKKPEYEKDLGKDFFIKMEPFFEEAEFLAPLFNGEDLLTSQEKLEKYLGNFIDFGDSAELFEDEDLDAQAELVRLTKLLSTIHVLEIIAAELCSSEDNPARYLMAAYDTTDHFMRGYMLRDRDELKNFLTEIIKVENRKILESESYMKQVGEGFLSIQALPFK